jgi:hypothetical protein
VIITPLLPTTWHVDWTPSGPGQGRVKSAWDGSVLQGTPDPGFAKTYAPTDYVTVAPASTHERAIDIGWYLRNQRESIPPGAMSL